jgi:hypothetical protein
MIASVAHKALPRRKPGEGWVGAVPLGAEVACAATAPTPEASFSGSPTLLRSAREGFGVRHAA